MGDKSTCSVICTLFKITFLGKWDERGERPLWSLTSFPDRHTYSVHSVQYHLSCFEQFCWDLIRTCGFATCCLTDGTSNLWTEWWRLLLPIVFFFIVVQVFTVPFRPVCWLDTLQTWLELLSHWFDYPWHVEKLPEFPFEFAVSNSMHMPWMLFEHGIDQRDSKTQKPMYCMGMHTGANWHVRRVDPRAAVMGEMYKPIKMQLAADSYAPKEQCIK